MSFYITNPDTKACQWIRLSAMANSALPRIFQYKSADTLAVIAAADYFLSVYKQLYAGDIIEVWAAGAVIPEKLLVTASSVTTVTTEVIGGVETLAAAKTLDVNDNGKTFILALAGGFAVTLPAPLRGYKVKIVVGIDPTTAYTVVTNAGAEIIEGLAVVNGATVACATKDTITFTASAAVQGDWVELVSDGTNWFVAGQAQAATGIAFS